MQIFGNAAISGGTTTVQGLITNDFSWKNIGISSAFGALGGGIGLHPSVKGVREVIIGAGLGIGEEGFNYLINRTASQPIYPSNKAPVFSPPNSFVPNINKVTDTPVSNPLTPVYVKKGFQGPPAPGKYFVYR